MANDCDSLDSSTQFSSEFETEGTTLQPRPKKIKKIPPVKVKPITPSELVKEIKGKIKVKKAPGYDLISGLILRNLSSKAVMKLAQIYNAHLTQINSKTMENGGDYCSPQVR